MNPWQPTHRWNWNKYPADDYLVKPRTFVGRHKGKLCRLVAVGKLNSVLIEFENGERFITLRYGLRKLRDK